MRREFRLSLSKQELRGIAQTHLRNLLLPNNHTRHKDRDVMLPLAEHIVCRSEKPDVPNFKACLFKDFARGGLSKGFAVLEMAAGKLHSTCDTVRPIRRAHKLSSEKRRRTGTVTACAFAHNDVACVVVDDNAYADLWSQRLIRHSQGDREGRYVVD